MQLESEDTPDVGSVVRVQKSLRLDHVIGQDDAVRTLRDLVNRIKYPEVFSLWGLEKPKAIALTGPPGCGKTFSIRALSNEVECPLIELCYEDTASHLLDESLQRLSAFKDQVEQLSEDHGHVLILIDEADSFFQNRFDTHAHPADKKKTNFFLRWIDGDLEGSSNFTLVVTSNAWDTIDPAFRRPGRFLEVPYRSLSPADVKKALRTHTDLAELSSGRLLFAPFEIEELTLPEGITGSDVKEIVADVCLKKATAFLDQYTASDPPSIDISDSDLISLQELAAAVNEYAAKFNLTKKRLAGFGRN